MKAQLDTTKCFFNSCNTINTENSEYSPFLWQNKLYFISDRHYYYSIVGNDKNSGLDFSDIFYSNVKNDKIEAPIHFENNINSKNNEGPICITSKGIYFTTNNAKVKNIKNPLEIKFSEYNTNHELNVSSRINIDLPDTVSFAYPAMVNDTTLIFSAKLLDSEGKTDLYISKLINKQWQKPINLGKLINSLGDDVFPYYVNGTLFFASDRKEGLGGLDLYSVDLNDDKNSMIKHLDSPLNSSFDDFGIWVDSTKQWGYLSSNRIKGNDNIYYFKENWPILDSCKEIKNHNYCYSFFEEASTESLDTTGLFYEWSFGDSTKSRGIEVEHCFNSPGKYNIELNIVEKLNQSLFYNQVSYEFEIKKDSLLYFDIPDTVFVNQNLSPIAHNYSSDSLVRCHFFWEFGDGLKSTELHVNHFYKKAGDYKIIFGVIENSTLTASKKVVCKKIHVSEKGLEPIKKVNEKIDNIIIKHVYEDSVINIASKALSNIKKENLYNFVNIKKENAPFESTKIYDIDENDSSYYYKVHLGSSKNYISSTDSIFNTLTPVSINKIDDLYHFFYGKSENLNGSNKLYNEAKEKGFKEAFILAFRNDSLMTGNNKTSYKMLNSNIIVKSRVNEISLVIFYKLGKSKIDNRTQTEINKLFSNIASGNIESITINGHTDNTGNQELNDKLSKKRSIIVKDYLVKININNELIINKYWGSKSPFNSNKSNTDKTLNRRVEIIIKLKNANRTN